MIWHQNFNKLQYYNILLRFHSIHGSRKDLQYVAIAKITCLEISRCNMFKIKPISLGYVARDCITVLINNVGSGVTSIICCITTARTSCVNKDFSWKHIVVAKTSIYQNPVNWTISTCVWVNASLTCLKKCYIARWRTINNTNYQCRRDADNCLNYRMNSADKYNYATICKKY